MHRCRMQDAGCRIPQVNHNARVKPRGWSLIVPSGSLKALSRYPSFPPPANISRRISGMEGKEGEGTPREEDGGSGQHSTERRAFSRSFSTPRRSSAGAIQVGNCCCRCCCCWVSTGQDVVEEALCCWCLLLFVARVCYVAPAVYLTLHSKTPCSDG